MTQIVNLRTERKRREKARERAKAAENAARFGRTKALKALEQTRADQAEAHIEAHRLEPK